MHNLSPFLERMIDASLEVLEKEAGVALLGCQR
jgi:hypothetical protein